MRIVDTKNLASTDGWLHHSVLEISTPATHSEPLPKVKRSRKRVIETPDALADDILIEEQVRLLAYDLFEQRGFEHGHDVEDWIRAEQLVLSRCRGRGTA